MKIVFDFDGTLLDSRARHLLLLKNILEYFNVRSYTLDDYLSYKADGHSTKEYLIAQLELDSILSDKICKMWIHQIEDLNYLKYDRLYDDSVATLESCKNAGHELYLLSARSIAEHFQDQVVSLRLLDYFHQVTCVSPENAAQNKIKFVKKTKIDFVVGDTEVDFHAAMENHIESYLLNRGFRSRKYWDERHVISYDSLMDLKRIMN